MSSPLRLTVLGGVLWAACAGCGRETYLTRLDETRRYFAYEDRLNQVLTPVAWAGRSFQLRVPKQFQVIDTKAKPGEDSEERDPRQPTFADIDLPGLQGAWQTSFSLTGDQGKGPGWLYLCSNYDLLGKKSDEVKAAGFNSELFSKLATTLGQAQKAPAFEKLPSSEIPPKGQEAWVEKRKFRSFNPGIPFTFNDKPYHARFYAYNKPKSKAQLGLVYVLPDDMAQAANLDHAIDMSLETLVVTREKPPPPSAKGGKGKGSAKGNSF